MAKYEIKTVVAKDLYNDPDNFNKWGYAALLFDNALPANLRQVGPIYVQENPVADLFADSPDWFPCPAVELTISAEVEGD